jgi:hypothetical protein
MSIVLPEAIGNRIGSREGEYEMVRTGVDKWDIWLRDYDSGGWMFWGTDADVLKTLEQGEAK